MTSDPPSPSPDGPPLPPRHRPSLDNITKDSTELDLWAFEDDLDLEAAPSKPARNTASRGDLPPPRERSVIMEREARGPNTSPAGGERIQMNVNKSRQSDSPSGEPVRILQPEDDFGDLENWDDVPKDAHIEELPEVHLTEEVAVPVAASEALPKPPTVAAAMPKKADDDEFSSVSPGKAAPISLRPHLSLTKLERIGLLALLVLLIGGGLLIFVSLNRLPSESARARATDFPIKGAKVTIESAASYWRAPITDGASPEIIRRGTVLLPVIELRIKEGNGAIRVLFRDDEGNVAGDAVTRAVRGTGVLVIPATAGFDDLGMHAAYRTGGSKPWTIEVYEAATEDSAGSDFKKLFEINISTDRR